MILVIGYANPLCGDDGVGSYVAECLAEEYGENVEILSRHQLTPELVEPISRVTWVIFIDAAYGAMPGEITVKAFDRMPGTDPFTHDMTPETLLAGARTLYGSRPNALMVTISSQRFEYGEGFSVAVEAALPALLDEVRERIRLCMSLESPTP